MSITGINVATPADTAFVGDGAAEIRALKAAVRAVFPGLNAAVTKPSAYGTNTGSTEVTSADMSQLFTDMESIVGDNATGVFAKGMIMMWSGTNGNIPTGWALCDGNAGTAINGVTIPDLTDRFIVGAGDTYTVGASGSGSVTVSSLTTSSPKDPSDGTTAKVTLSVGSSTTGTADIQIADHTLTEDNIPKHFHYVAGNDDFNGNNSISPGQGISTSATLASQATDGSSDDEYRFASSASSDADTFESSQWPDRAGAVTAVTHSGTANYDHVHSLTGGSFSGSALPDYYALSYIIYTGAAA